MPTAAAAVEHVRGRLLSAGVATPAVDAEQLVLHATGWSRTKLIVDGHDPLPPEAAMLLQDGVARREAREPLQLILGSVGFRYLDLEVRPGVFIPRPETELLVEYAAARLPAAPVVVEPCTGTGAVACAIATESTGATVFATDVSVEAVALTKANARRTGAPVVVLQGDLLGPLPNEVKGSVDAIVCNPPYLAEDDVAALAPEVSRWDPVAALVAGPTGHEVSDRLLNAATHWLRPGGWLLVEVDSTRAAETARRAAARGLAETAVLRDLTGAERFVVGRRSPGA